MQKQFSNNTLLQKPLNKILIINWSRFALEEVIIKDCTLITGESFSGKSTILDALVYALTGNTHFNVSAGDKGRTVASCVRGYTSADGDDMYLRKGDVTSYIAMEFYSPTDNYNITVGVCIESTDDLNVKSCWFCFPDTSISDINFYYKNSEGILATPKNQLKNKGVSISLSSFLKRDKGPNEIQLKLGIRGGANDYKRRIVSMLCYKDNKEDIDTFIRNNVLPENMVSSLSDFQSLQANLAEAEKFYGDILSELKDFDKLEISTQKYEAALDAYYVNQAELYWQNYILSDIQRTNNNQSIIVNQSKLDQLNIQADEAQKSINDAHDMWMEADRCYHNSDVYAAIESLKTQIKSLDQDIKRSRYEASQVDILKSNALSILSDISIDATVRDTINAFDLPDVAADAKQQAVDFLKIAVKNRLDELNEDKYELNHNLKVLSNDISDLENIIKQRENSQRGFPSSVLNIKNRMNAELVKKGINEEVHIFAELVEDITDESWRDAIETYLGNRRFSFIIDGRYVGDALEIFHRLKVYDYDLIGTDHLSDRAPEDGSAATLLKISNIYARRYANYLLGAVHLCDTVEDLHRCTRCGLMRDGMSYKSKAYRNMRIKDVQYYLGYSSIKLQLEKDKAKLVELRSSESELKRRIADNANVIKNFETHSVDMSVDFVVAQNLTLFTNKRNNMIDELAKQQSHPEVTLLERRLNDAKVAWSAANELGTQILIKIARCKEEIADCEKSRPILDEAVVKNSKIFEDFVSEPEHMGIRQKAIDKYNKYRRDDGEAIKPDTINVSERNMRNAESDMVNDQKVCCAHINLNPDKCGAMSIGVFREEYNKIKNVNAEKTKQDISNYKNRIRNVIANEFITALDENIKSGLKELDNINAALAGMPFGQQIYEFKPRERSDRAIFFKIRAKLSAIRNQGNVDNSLETDNELQQDIDEFTNDFLSDADIDEYADYRTYYHYDMFVKNLETGIKFNYSKKKDFASNCEKQVPYYIVLAAGLSLCYPPNKVCARIAFVDEAFAAFDDEKQVQMMNYFDMHGLQVIYAAPQRQIGEIGRRADTMLTVSIIGKYSRILEGIYKHDDKSEEIIEDAV